MFEIIKWLLLVALMLGIGNASMYLEEVDYGSFHQQVTCGIAVLDCMAVFIIGLITFCTVAMSSDGLPHELSNVLTIIIIVEFIYLLFVYGKVIPSYMDSGKVVPKNKETIKIN